MSAGDFIVIGIITIILGLSIYELVRDKKRGKKCIGCSYSDSCTRNKGDKK